MMGGPLNLEQSKRTPLDLSIRLFSEKEDIYLENFVFVRLKGMQLHLETAQIPKSDSAVGTPGRQNVLREGVERETIDLSHVRLNRLTGLVCRGTASVPDHEPLIISNRAENRLMKRVPGNVFHDVGVTSENGLCVNYPALLLVGIDVPHANGLDMRGHIKTIQHRLVRADLSQLT